MKFSKKHPATPAEELAVMLALLDKLEGKGK